MGDQCFVVYLVLPVRATSDDERVEGTDELAEGDSRGDLGAGARDNLSAFWTCDDQVVIGSDDVCLSKDLQRPGDVE